LAGYKVAVICCAGILIIAVFRRSAGTHPSCTSIIECTWISVITRCVVIDKNTFSGIRIAGIISTWIYIIACNRSIVTLTGYKVAVICGAGILIIATRPTDTDSSCTSIIECTGISIVTRCAVIGKNTISSNRITEIISTGISVIAGNRSMATHTG
jgi:hypothetical protein